MNKESKHPSERTEETPKPNTQAQETMIDQADIPSSETDIFPDPADEMQAALEENTQDGEMSTEDKIAALEVEIKQLKDQTLRAMAESENIRKRSERQMRDERTYAVERFAKDLLSVSDNLARALTSIDSDQRKDLPEAAEHVLSGIEITEKELHAIFARHGVQAIAAVEGDDFDPNLHQAVSQIPSEAPKGKIAQTFQTGWQIGERVLRAAMVAVSSGPT